MLLKASISTTKKFLKKTICNFKSFFSKSYHRLPKAAMAAPPITAGPKTDKDSTFHSTPSQTEVQNGSFTNNNNNNVNNNSATFSQSIDPTQESSESSWKRREEMCLVAMKIKELEKLEGRNVDIEEVLHYYSRLTCPIYLQIVDKFFLEVFAEFCSNSSSPQNYTPKSLVRKSSCLRNLESSTSSNFS